MRTLDQAPPEGMEECLPGAETAFLLIHGFGADADELASMARFLRSSGFSSFSVRLAGHGSTPEALALTGRSDWLRSAERGLDYVLSWKPRHVVIAGLSMGALLALQLSLGRREIAGLILISPALLLGGFVGKLLPVLKRIVRYRSVDLEAIQKAYGYDLPRTKYDREPLAAIHQVIRLASEVRQSLQRVRTPTLILQAGDDRTIDPRSGKLVYDGISSSVKELHCIEGAPHVIPCHPKRALAYSFILPFIQTALPEDRD